MRIYLASSWRNPNQPAALEMLRSAGHDVYDFRNPSEGDTGFSWRSCASEEDLKDPELFRTKVLPSPIAQAGFEKDMLALANADCTVLLLPCGRSAHLELGFAVGYKQKTYVVLDNPMSEPELMYLMVTCICTSVREVIDHIPLWTPSLDLPMRGVKRPGPYGRNQ